MLLTSPILVSATVLCIGHVTLASLFFFGVFYFKRDQALFEHIRRGSKLVPQVDKYIKYSKLCKTHLLNSNTIQQISSMTRVPPGLLVWNLTLSYDHVRTQYDLIRKQWWLRFSSEQDCVHCSCFPFLTCKLGHIPLQMPISAGSSLVNVSPSCVKVSTWLIVRTEQVSTSSGSSIKHEGWVVIHCYITKCFVT